MHRSNGNSAVGSALDLEEKGADVKSVLELYLTAKKELEAALAITFTDETERWDY
ncbi:hypothetical protein HDU93_003250 [Gonapodya sp. JEL0774]|nr:hypothetical protein HDU93_003250 [Gonapodya sp. JEL0774]